MTPSPSSRATKYPYPKLINKRFNKMTRQKYRFKVGEEEKVQKSIIAHCRAKDWFVVCRILTNDRTGESYLEVWGDMDLRFRDLPPAEVEELLRKAGYDIRKQRHIAD